MKLELSAANDPQGLVLRGELNLYQVEEAKEVILARLASQSRLELDLSAVESCDAAGLQLLIATRREAEAAGKSLVVKTRSQAVLACAQTLGVAAACLPAGLAPSFS